MLFLSLQLSPLPQSDGVSKNVCDYTFDYFFHCLNFMRVLQTKSQPFLLLLLKWQGDFYLGWTDIQSQENISGMSLWSHWGNVQ